MSQRTPLLLTLILTALLFTISCDNGEKEVALLEKEVLDVHDEVMPLMGPRAEIDILVTSLQDSMAVYIADSTVDHSEKLATFQEAIDGLESANESMMTWMREYQPGIGDGQSLEDRLSYLNDELVKVNDMKALTLASIEAAKSLIQ
ncbi:MAG: hypothetical protein AAF388_07715 [Bacteroidota bacterium]